MKTENYTSYKDYMHEVLYTRISLFAHGMIMFLLGVFTSEWWLVLAVPLGTLLAYWIDKKYANK